MDKLLHFHFKKGIGLPSIRGVAPTTVEITTI
jgi:hypothetical protein